MHRHRPRRPRLAPIIACVLSGIACLTAADGGIGIAPGIILIEDAPLGMKLDLGAQGLTVQVSNGGAQAETFELKAIVPGPDEIQAYEAGYEPLPDPAWVRLEHAQVEVPAHGTARAGITLDFPDRPELANRHFMLYIEAGPKATASLGAVLRVRARAMIETAVDAHPGATSHPAAIAVAPGRIDMARAADGGWSGEVAVANHGEQPATFDLLTLRQAYGAGDEDRRTRFFGSGQTALVDADWAVPDSAGFTLAPGATRTVQLRAKPPRALKPDEQVDEVLFLARRAGPDVPAQRRRRLNGVDYDRGELLRLRYAAPREPAKP
jgi:hypothetical protein